MHLCVAIGMTDIFAILAGPAQNNEVNFMTKPCSLLRYLDTLNLNQRGRNVIQSQNECHFCYSGNVAMFGLQ